MLLYILHCFVSCYTTVTALSTSYSYLYVLCCLFSVEGPDAAKKAAAYDVEIEIDDPKKAQMNAFMMSSQNQQVHTVHTVLSSCMY